MCIGDRYEAALPVSVRAGRDILGMSALGLHSNANDLSQVMACLLYTSRCV